MGEFKFDYWLYAKLKERGMTQKQLSKLSGVSESAITLYLARRRKPTMSTLMKILKVFDARIVVEDRND